MAVFARRNFFQNATDGQNFEPAAGGFQNVTQQSFRVGLAHAPQNVEQAKTERGGNEGLTTATLARIFQILVTSEEVPDDREGLGAQLGQAFKVVNELTRGTALAQAKGFETFHDFSRRRRIG